MPFFPNNYLKYFLVVFALFFTATNATAQKDFLEKKITIKLKKVTIADAIKQIQEVSGTSFAYDPSIIPNQKIQPKTFRGQSLRSVLTYVLSGTNLSFQPVLNSIVIKANILTTYALHGIVTDAQTGENLIGAKIQVNGTSQFSNQYGYFSISLPANNYVVNYTYMGYKLLIEDIALQQDEYRKVSLTRAPFALKVVKISGQPGTNDSLEIANSVKTLTIRNFERLPYFGGEIDLIKGLQAQAGVKNLSEGSSGMSVRGGGLDQNLILVDEAPVYNPSHLFGLISIFNSDAIKSVDFYTDYIPTRFGGRLSSVIDTKLDEGDLTEYHLKGGISLLSARLTAEGPIVKDKGSFLLSARRSLTDIYNSGFSFFNVNARYYDLNFKSNYILDRKNRVFLSGYHGFDHLFSPDNFANDWTNSTATLRLNHVYNPRLFLNFSAIYSNYRNSQSIGNAKNWLTGIRDITFKGDFNFYIVPGNTIEFGGVGTRHHFKPGETIPPNVETSLNRLSALESAVYFNQDVDVSNTINLKYGIRAGLFSASKKNDGKLGYAAPTSYFNIEPRFQLGFKVSENQFLKLTYNRTVQNLQLIQNNEQAYSALETWLPTDRIIKPQTADFIAASYNYLGDKSQRLELSIYYRKSHNQTDLLDHSQIIQNPNFENQLRFGTGKAYGLELSLKRKVGIVLAEAVYTYSRTFRKIEDINNGIEYPASYDTPNDLKLNLDVPVTDRFSVNALFNYQTGRAITLPVGFYVYNGTEVPIFEGRNNARFPAFSRLDVSAVLHPKVKESLKSKRQFKSTWRFGVYNLYNRRNPLFYRISQAESDRNIGFEESFSGILPTFSYSFYF